MVYQFIKGSFRALNIRSKALQLHDAKNYIKLTWLFQMCSEILISFNFVPAAFLSTQVLYVHKTLTLFQISYCPCSTAGLKSLIWQKILISLTKIHHVPTHDPEQISTPALANVLVR